VVSETEQVVITQFGKIVRDPILDPGLKFKVPFIEKASFFPKNIQEWDGEPGQIPTLDKTFIWVDAFARWKIVDPVKFSRRQQPLQRRQPPGTTSSIRPCAISSRLTGLIEAVRKSNRELDTTEVGLEDQEKKPHLYVISLCREKITQGVLEQAQPR